MRKLIKIGGKSLKKTLLQSAFLLLIFSSVGKIISFVVRILLARQLNSDAMNAYTLAAPTMFILITMAQLGIPAALSKVTAQSKSTYPPLLASLIILCANTLFLSISFSISAPFLATHVIRQENILLVFQSILPLLPLVSLSGALKGYLYGIQKPIQAGATQVWEEFARLLFLYVAFALCKNLDAVYMASIAMLSISIGEAASCLYMVLSMHISFNKIKKVPVLIKHLKKEEFTSILTLSLPMTCSRMIGSLCSFLEPMIMLFDKNKMQIQQMIQTYGQINGYLLPILTMPTFLTITLSNLLLPTFTYHYARHNYKRAKTLFFTISLCCFGVGVVCSSICFFYPEQLLQLFYHSTKGADALKLLSFPFSFYSLQPCLSNLLHALALSKKSVFDTFLGCLIRLFIISFCSCILQEKALYLGLCAGMLITTCMHAIRVCIAFKKMNV